MPQASINTIPRGLDNDQLTEEINKRLKELDWLLSRLDSKNLFEVGGWRVSKKQLASKDGSVGFSTEDTSLDDVRIWAGDAKDRLPRFKVTKSGILTAIAAILMSATGYPKIELNGSSNLLQAFKDADNWISISPNITGAPGLHFKSPLVEALISMAGNALMINTLVGRISLDALGDIIIRSTNGKITFSNWNNITSQGNNYRTLQDELNSLQSQISNLNARVTALESRPTGP